MLLKNKIFSNQNKNKFKFEKLIMYFCYLIESQSEKYKGDAYIGFAVDPLKRLREHNGEIKGGAKKTSKKRPWELVSVVSNFPNKMLALQFEWAWQNPLQSKFLQQSVKFFLI